MPQLSQQKFALQNTLAMPQDLASPTNALLPPKIQLAPL